MVFTKTLVRSERYDILALSPKGKLIKISVKTVQLENSKRFSLSQKDEEGRSNDFYCKERYITEQEMTNQLIALIPQLKLRKEYILANFDHEIRRVNNLRSIIENSNYKGIEMTKHNTGIIQQSDTSDEMIQNYLLHILQFGNPEERMKILEGIKTKLMLYGGRLIIDN